MKSFYTIGYRGRGAKHDCFKKDTIFEIIDTLIDLMKYDPSHKICVAFWEESCGFYCTWRYSGDDFIKLINKLQLPKTSGMYNIWVCDKKEPSNYLMGK